MRPPDIAVQHTSVRVLDVREREEVVGGRIPASVNIPLGQLVDRLDALTPGVPVVTVCQSGGRSRRAAEALALADDSAVERFRRDLTETHPDSATRQPA
jgi:rhodanese-related sulfurtransferase